MKIFAITICLFFVSLSAIAQTTQNIPSYFYEANNTLNVLTNVFTASPTNNSVTNVQATYPALYNTFQFVYTCLGTNGTGSNVVDYSIDGANWLPQQTNSFSTNAVFQYTFVGMQLQVRARSYFQATNSTFTETYAGRSP